MYRATLTRKPYWVILGRYRLWRVHPHTQSNGGPCFLCSASLFSFVPWRAPGGSSYVRRGAFGDIRSPKFAYVLSFSFFDFFDSGGTFGKWHCPAPRSSRPIVKPARGLVLYLVGLEYGGSFSPMLVTQTSEWRCRRICRKTGVVVTCKCCCSGASSEETSA